MNRSDEAAPVIEIEGLDYRFDNGPLVLEDVSLQIAKGDFASIIGPNGGGKTTLVKLIIGLFKPSAGRVRVLGLSPVKARVASFPSPRKNPRPL